MRRVLALAGVALAVATIAARVPAAALQIPAASAPASPAPPTGLILGQVVDVVTGKPIPEATVSVTMRGGPGAGTLAGGRLGGTVVLGAGRQGLNPQGGPVRLLTGADGRFVLHDLPKGVANITAIAAGYVQGAAGQARPTGPTRPILLDDGERVTDVRIRLWKHAVVTGTVVDENGEPAVGITVRMLRQQMVNGKPQYQPGSLAKTDDRGVYRISAITPGTFLMTVPQTITTMPTSTVDTMMQSMAGSMPQMSSMVELMGAGAPPPNMGGGVGRRVGDFLVSSITGGLPPGAGDRVAVYQTAFYPASANGQSASFTLGSGEERSGVDFQLRPLPAVRVSGAVTGTSGPLLGLQIRLMPSGGLDFSSDNGLEAATTMAAGDGTFALLGVPAGQYTLSLVKPAQPPMPAGMASSPLMQFAGGMSPGGQPVPLFAQASVTVGGTDVNGITLALAEGAKVTGRLEFAGASPMPQPGQIRNITLVSADGRPVPAVGGFGPAANSVDQNMQFKTAGYPPGRYVVEQVGIPPWAVTSVTIAGRDVTDEGFELKNSDLADAIITFGDKSTTLTGNVRMSSGGATATATVLAFPSDVQGWIANGMTARRARTAVATKQGTFTMTGLPAGDYLLIALDDNDVGDPRDPAFITAAARGATRITLSDGEQKTQDLPLTRMASR